MNKYYLPIMTLGAVLCAPGALAADVTGQDSAGYVTVRTVDFSGKPPFARRTERLPVAEVARLEAESTPIAIDDPAAGELVTVRTTDFSGKPPYTRRTETLPVAEVARLEAAGPTLTERPDRAGRPSFRRDRSWR